MAERLAPSSETDVVEAVQWALGAKTPLEIVSGGSKRGLGRPIDGAQALDLGWLTGMRNYEPAEMVFDAGPATPVGEIEAELAAKGQQLGFEPPDLGPLLGGSDGRATLGGIMACNLSGPRRTKAFAARDHLLGLKAVTGRGEAVKTGGRVVKNVTGYDLCKLMAGSWGTLGVITDLTVRALPAPERTRTVLVFGLDDGRGLEALRAALATPHEASAAAHLPVAVAARSHVSYIMEAGASVSAVRVEGFGPSVEARCLALRDTLGAFGPVEELHSKNSGAFWREVRDVAPFTADAAPQVWRLSVTPDKGASVVAEIAGAVPGAEAFYDWGGGLVWLAMPARDDGAASVVRGALGEAGGHALLVRASEKVRRNTAVFHPQPAALAALSARLKRGFDPDGVLNPGRMVAGS
jgi:glycolate oxidase FAD binding subunit